MVLADKRFLNLSVGTVWRRYNLTGWAIKLNEVTPGLEEHLAPTDCRLRPDQHSLELGQYDQVALGSRRKDAWRAWLLWKMACAALSAAMV